MTAPVFLTGDNPSAAQVNDWFVNVAIAYKTATQSVVSSTTPVNDNHLALAVAANTTYRVELYMNTSSGLSVGDLSWKLTGPTAAVLNMFVAGGDTTAGASTGPLSIQNLVLNSLASGTARYSPTWAVGTLVTSATAGTLQLLWAQNVSDTTATLMNVGSYMYLTRLA